MGSINTMTPKFRVSFPAVFRAQANKDFPDQEPKFSLTALFAPDADLSALKAAAHAAAEAKWGANPKKWPKFRYETFRKHEEFAKENDDGKLVFQMGMEKGGHLLRLSTKQKPGLIDKNNNDIIDETDFYAGCYARATVRAYAYETKGNCGVSFGLQNIQKLADGEPLTGRAKAQDEFSPIVDKDNPTGDVASIF